MAQVIEFISSSKWKNYKFAKTILDGIWCVWLWVWLKIVIKNLQLIMWKHCLEIGIDLSHSINYKCPVIVICDAHKSWSKHLVYLESTLSSTILPQSRGPYEDFAFQDASLLFFPCFFFMVLMGITRKNLNKIFFLFLHSVTLSELVIPKITNPQLHLGSELTSGISGNAPLLRHYILEICLGKELSWAQCES